MSKLHMLLALQTALLLFLGYRMITLEGRTIDLAAKMVAAQNGAPVTLEAPTGTRAIRTSNIASQQETRLIIREEFDVLSEHLLLALEQQYKTTNWPGKPQARTLSADEKAQLSATVENTLSGYRARGAASQSEIAALELMIAKLPPRERIKAMGALNKAINSGELNTRF